MKNIKIDDKVYFIEDFKVIRGKVTGMHYESATRELGGCWTIQAEKTQQIYKGYYSIYTTKKEALKALLEAITAEIDDLNERIEYFKGLQFDVYNEYFNHEELKSYR